MQTKTIAAFAAAAVLGFAGTAAAQSSAPFCNNIAAIAQKIDASIQKRADAIAQFKSSASGKKETRWSANDQKLSQVRDAADKRRAQDYANLNAKAATDAQKAAVAQFQSTIDGAIASRRAAVDAAIKAYRDGLDSAIDAHVGAMSSAQASFKSTVDAAIAAAQSQCSDSSAKGPAIRSSLQDTIKTAQSAFQDARKDSKLEDARSQLAATRKSAVEKAFADFRATAEQARTTLKAAFQQ